MVQPAGGAVEACDGRTMGLEVCGVSTIIGVRNIKRRNEPKSVGRNGPKQRLKIVSNERERYPGLLQINPRSESLLN